MNMYGHLTDEEQEMLACAILGFDSSLHDAICIPYNSSPEKEALRAETIEWLVEYMNGKLEDYFERKEYFTRETALHAFSCIFNQDPARLWAAQN